MEAIAETHRRDIFGGGFINVEFAKSTPKSEIPWGDKLRCYSDKEFRNSCAKLTSQKEDAELKISTLKSQLLSL